MGRAVSAVSKFYTYITIVFRVDNIGFRPLMNSVRTSAWSNLGSLDQAPVEREFVPRTALFDPLVKRCFEFRMENNGIAENINVVVGCENSVAIVDVSRELFVIRSPESTVVADFIFVSIWMGVCWDLPPIMFSIVFDS